VEGRDIRLCCAGCSKKLQADPAKYIAKIDEAIIEQQKPLYPMDICPVSGQKLGEMGDPVAKVYNNRLVQFCCSGCVKKFEADPATYLGKLDDAAIAAQVEDYPFDKCVVSGEELDENGGPVDMVKAGRLVRFCCANCVAKFDANPSKYLNMIKSGKMSKMEASDDDDEGSDHKH
jgi:YHS domain-containing protein